MTSGEIADAVRVVWPEPIISRGDAVLVLRSPEAGWLIESLDWNYTAIHDDWAAAILLCELRKMQPSPERDEAIKKLEALK